MTRCDCMKLLYLTTGAENIMGLRTKLSDIHWCASGMRSYIG